MANEIEINNCPLCASVLFKDLFQAREYTFFKKDKYHLVQCANCHLVFLNPQPADTDLEAFYPQEYFSQEEDKFRASLPRFMILDKTKEISRFKDRGKLLDVGCGQGWFLQKMQNLGWEVRGIDLSARACELTSEKIGKENVFKGDLFSVNLPQGYFDVITLWHVIEHSRDPVHALKRTRTLLKEDGILFICCPNFGSWLRIIFRDKWFQLSAPHHLTHFTADTLKLALKFSGFKVKHQKKHFIDPITNMGSLKLSLLRLLGLGYITVLNSDITEKVNVIKRSLYWRIARTTFNITTLIFSFILSLLGNEDSILILAVKENKK